MSILKLFRLKRERVLEKNVFPRQIPTLKQIGDTCANLLECEYDYGPDEFLRQPEHSDLYLIQMAFGHCHCVEFSYSLLMLTNWPIARICDERGEFIHVVNTTPEGHMVDVYGHSSMEEIRNRYQRRGLIVNNDSRISRPKHLDDDSAAEIMAAMLYIEKEPFISIREKITYWIKYGQTNPAVV
jgi:hypothetical protein